jgi:cytochrome b6-f complex iron-sulfur subunit
MSGGAVIVIAVSVLVVLAAFVLLGASRRHEKDEAVGHLSRETRSRDRSETQVLAGVGARESGRDVERAAALERKTPSTELVVQESRVPAPWVPPDPEALAVTRRQFLNRSIVGLMGFSVTAFGLACVGFLWPQSTGGFGSKIKVGKISDIIAYIEENGGFGYYPAGRMWITEYPAAALDKAKQVYPPSILAGMEAGVVALYQKCPHLGCRVPACVTSQWFECPCHGSQYNQVGEKKGGPAPRGMDHFAMEVENDVLTVDTGNVILGPVIGTNTTGQEAEGPHCISGAGGE